MISVIDVIQRLATWFREQSWDVEIYSDFPFTKKLEGLNDRTHVFISPLAGEIFLSSRQVQTKTYQIEIYISRRVGTEKNLVSELFALEEEIAAALLSINFEMEKTGQLVGYVKATKVTYDPFFLPEYLEESGLFIGKILLELTTLQ